MRYYGCSCQSTLIPPCQALHTNYFHAQWAILPRVSHCAILLKWQRSWKMLRTYVVVIFQQNGNQGCVANAKSTQTAWQLIVIAITKMNQLASLKKKLIIQNYTALLSNILVVAMVIMPPLIDVKIRLLPASASAGNIAERSCPYFFPSVYN